MAGAILSTSQSICEILMYLERVWVFVTAAIVVLVCLMGGGFSSTHRTATGLNRAVLADFCWEPKHKLWLAADLPSAKTNTYGRSRDRGSEAGSKAHLEAIVRVVQLFYRQKTRDEEETPLEQGRY